jgi:hypothetical protein
MNVKREIRVGEIIRILTIIAAMLGFIFATRVWK